jgi:hypothetical protein
MPAGDEVMAALRREVYMDSSKVVLAISAHGMWKVRLESAINTGASEFDPAVVETDNKCEFGRWLHGDIDPVLKQQPNFKKVVDLHAAFHREAARILRLALAGQANVAAAEISEGSKYFTLSTQLTHELEIWKNL